MASSVIPFFVLRLARVGAAGEVGEFFVEGGEVFPQAGEVIGLDAVGGVGFFPEAEAAEGVGGDLARDEAEAGALKAFELRAGDGRGHGGAEIGHGPFVGKGFGEPLGGLGGRELGVSEVTVMRPGDAGDAGRGREGVRDETPFNPVLMRNADLGQHGADFEGDLREGIKLVGLEGDERFAFEEEIPVEPRALGLEHANPEAFVAPLIEGGGGQAVGVGDQVGHRWRS